MATAVATAGSIISDIVSVEWTGDVAAFSEEVITLTVFVPFAILYLREKPTLDYLWATLCLAGAAFFLFRKMPTG